MTLPRLVEIREILRTFKDVEIAFKRRGYNFEFIDNGKTFLIKADTRNMGIEEIIAYEFEGKTKENAFFHAAGFLQQVQALREEFGLEVN